MENLKIKKIKLKEFQNIVVIFKINSIDLKFLVFRRPTYKSQKKKKNHTKNQ